MTDQAAAPEKSGFSGAQVLLIVLLTVLVTAGGCYWAYRTYINPADFKPVQLSQKEQSRLDQKLQKLGINPRELLPNAPRQDQFDGDGRLIPEKYVENADKRDVRLSERELNAIVASNPDLASRFAIDLSDDLASAKLLIPMDPDFPVMGGRTLRINAGLEVAYGNGQPVVKMRGISVMGVPLPNAWLGNLKNVDLVSEFGDDPGFWNAFAAGVDLVEIEDGEIHIKLKE